jgi:hypothetical protein
VAQPINVDQLVDRACRTAGLDRFDSETFLEGLALLADEMNRQDLPEANAERFAGSVVSVLATRLRVHDYLVRRPELLGRPIERPLVVFGMPRTGTTLLNNLLAADPARRSPLSWEIDEPVPPPAAARLKTDPRALRRLEQERRELAADPSRGKYYRSSALYPKECLFFSGAQFQTLNWESFGRLPGYRDYVFGADVRPTYDYHKRFLQLLQADAPGVWNLKQPSHGLHLETLLAVYPDARLIWMHRDPLVATASFCSLGEVARRALAGRADRRWIGENQLWQAVQHVERIMDARDRIGEERIADVHYAELLADPVGTMRRLYAALADDFTPEAEAGMRAWLGENPQGKFGWHEYRLADYGLSERRVRASFERYLSRYAIAPGGRPPPAQA